MSGQATYDSVRKRTLGTLAAAQVVSGVGLAGVGTAGALLVFDITGKASLSGLAQTASITGAALMAIPLARLTERGGRRLALGSGYSVAALGSVLAVIGGTRGNLPLMLIGTLLAGAGTASGYQARFAAADLSPEEHRGRDLSIVLWAGTVGSVLGPNLLEWSGHVAHAVGLPILVGPYLLAGACLLGGLLILTVFLRPDPYLLAVRSSGRPARVRRHSFAASLAEVRRSREASVALSAVVIGHVVMVSVMVMTPVHMETMDVSLRIIGLVISVHILGMYALSPVMGWLSDRWGRLAVIRLGVVVLALSAVTAGTAPMDDSLRLGVGLFLLGLGWSATLVAGSTLLSDSIDVDHRPGVQGISDMFMNGAAAVGGAVAGVIIAALDYAWLCALALIPIAMLGFATMLPSRSMAQR